MKIHNYEKELELIVHAIKDNLEGKKPKLHDILTELHPLWCGYSAYQCNKLRILAQSKFT